MPWTRLGWVAWRRYRAALVATAVLLGALALYLAVAGSAMRSEYDAALACQPQDSPACHFAWNAFSDHYSGTGLLSVILVFAPAVLGAFTGAPLLARELETGTFRFAWTQGAGRMRWLVALLVPGVLGVAAVGLLFGALVTWYQQPLISEGDMQRLRPTLFPITGVAVAGWAVLAYALGVLAGMLIRRVAPALATTLATWTGLALLASELRRYHYLAPLTTSNPTPALGDLHVGEWWTHAGVVVSDAQVNQVLQSIGVQIADPGGNVAAKPGGPGLDPFQYLLDHGYMQWTAYQPDSRYWTFQAIELGWLLATALVLLGATVWLVRRRGA